MASIFQRLLNRAKWEVSLLRIERDSDNSCVFSFEARVTGTGPINWTISPMEVDIAFGGCPFAKLMFPEIRTRKNGTRVNIRTHQVSITDVATFYGFIRSLLVNLETSFQLENGRCDVNFLGLARRCNYRLDICIRSVIGPKLVLRKVEQALDTDPRADPRRVTLTFDVHNPGPAEILYGMAFYGLRNDKDEVIADLLGDLAIQRRRSEAILTGLLRDGAVLSQKARLEGRGLDNICWWNEAIQLINTAVHLKPNYREQLLAGGDRLQFGGPR